MRATKDSGVEWIGEIPESWVVDRMRGFFRCWNRKNTHLARTNALKFSDGSIVAKPGDAADDAALDVLRTYQLADKGSLVINGLNLNYDLKSKRTGLVEEDGVITSAYLVITPKETMLSRYANYLFKGYDYRKAYHNMGTGIRKTLNWSEYKHVPLIVPPVAEQQLIADYLDERCAAIDAQRAMLEKEVDALQRLRKSTIHKAVTQGLDESVSMKETGVDWLIQIPSHWHLEKLNHFASAELGLMIDKKRETTNNVHKYLSCRDVSWFSINSAGLAYTSFPSGSEARYGIKDGDIMVCEGGEVGRSCVWRGQAPDFYYQKSVHRLRVNPSVAYPEYIAYQMFQKAKVSEFREIRKGEATIGHLPGDQLSQLRFVLPPLDEQHQIAAFLDNRCAAIDTVIDTRTRQISRLEDYRKALVFQYVTGKKEVPA